MHTRTLRSCFIALVFLGLGGCFPIELDVNEKGELLIYRSEGFFIFDQSTKLVTPIIGPGPNVPVFARFAPGGREVLTVCKEPTRGQFLFDIVSLADGTSRPLYTSPREASYARFSPDGTYLALTKMSERNERDEKFREAAPELVVVNVKKGTHQRFSDLRVHAFFRWYQDNERVLAMTLTEKDKEGRLFGHISEINVKSGKVTPIVSLASDQRVFFDLAPNNKKAVVIARVMGPADQMPVLRRDDYTPPTLHEIDLDSKTSKNLDIKSAFAIYSPTGKKLLLTADPKRFDLETKLLQVANSDGSNPITIADDFAQSMMAGGGTEGLKLPGWRGDDSIFYLTNRKSYGSTERSAWLKTIAADGSAPTFLQPWLDLGVLEAEPKIINPSRPPVQLEF